MILEKKSRTTAALAWKKKQNFLLWLHVACSDVGRNSSHTLESNYSKATPPSLPHCTISCTSCAGFHPPSNYSLCRCIWVRNGCRTVLPENTWIRWECFHISCGYNLLWSTSTCEKFLCATTNVWYMVYFLALQHTLQELECSWQLENSASPGPLSNTESTAG